MATVPGSLKAQGLNMAQLSPMHMLDCAAGPPYSRSASENLKLKSHSMPLVQYTGEVGQPSSSASAMVPCSGLTCRASIKGSGELY